MSEPPVYASDPHAEPDSSFVPGTLAHLVPGNRGRLLDPRRTPISIVDVDARRGAFVVRVEAFEDAGAEWELALEDNGNFQFERGVPTADPARTGELERAVARFARDIEIDVDDATHRASLALLAARRDEAAAWLVAQHPEPAIDLEAHVVRREGSPELCEVRTGFLRERGLLELDEALSAAFVTNPRAGELVKGHAIVLAELGLCADRGRVPRDPDIFAGEMSRTRRREHLLWRLSFTQAVLNHIGIEELTLYRGAASDGELVPRRAGSFVSATFSRAVAESHFEGGPSTRVAVLWRERVPAERAFMTFLETSAMNRRFQEAEAVLIGDGPGLAATLRTADG